MYDVYVVYKNKKTNKIEDDIKDYFQHKGHVMQLKEDIRGLLVVKGNQKVLIPSSEFYIIDKDFKNNLRCLKNNIEQRSTYSGTTILKLLSIEIPIDFIMYHEKYTINFLRQLKKLYDLNISKECICRNIIRLICSYGFVLKIKNFFASDIMYCFKVAEQIINSYGSFKDEICDSCITKLINNTSSKLIKQYAVYLLTTFNSEQIVNLVKRRIKKC